MATDQGQSAAAHTGAVDCSALLEAARRELASLPTVLAALLGGLDPGTARRRPAPQEWSPVEIVCHLRDEETEDFGGRLRLIAAGGRAFEPIDPEGWVEARRYRDTELGAALAALRARRAESLAFLADLDPARLPGEVHHPGLGTMSGCDVLAAWVAHDRLHVGQLAGTLARLWADGWAPLRVDYAGDIPHAPPAR